MKYNRILQALPPKKDCKGLRKKGVKYINEKEYILLCQSAKEVSRLLTAYSNGIINNKFNNN